MKKITFLLSCFVLFSAFTCENESLDSSISPTSNNSASLIGDWAAIEFEGSAVTESTILGQSFQSEITFEGANLDYILSFDGANFTVNGAYDVVTMATVNGQTIGPDTQSYTNVTGNGTYSTSSNMITIDGGFYEFDMIDGVDNLAAGPQTANFTLSADGQTLTFIQDEQQTQSSGGIDVDIDVVSTSVWQRQ